jgi:hypothetical protein
MPDDILESESFQEILTTLRALAANDDRIIEYFRSASHGRQHTGGGSVEFDIDERLAQRIDLAQFVREIDLKCWDRLQGILKPPLTLAQILEWADAHHCKSGRWPSSTSGFLLGVPGEKWGNINSALDRGHRGQPGKSSLAQLLHDKRGVKNYLALSDLTVE